MFNEAWETIIRKRIVHRVSLVWKCNAFIIVTLALCEHASWPVEL